MINFQHRESICVPSAQERRHGRCFLRAVRESQTDPLGPSAALTQTPTGLRTRSPRDEKLPSGVRRFSASTSPPRFGAPVGNRFTQRQPGRAQRNAALSCPTCAAQSPSTSHCPLTSPPDGNWVHPRARGVGTPSDAAAAREMRGGRSARRRCLTGSAPSQNTSR
jgi:hypothetical protein